MALALVVLVLGAALHATYGDTFVGMEPLYRGAHAEGSDDAYITFRYARNLLEGHGPVFNPGERVEGYTNPLYTLLMLPLLAWGGDAGIYRLSVAATTACAIAALFLFLAIVRERLPDGAPGSAALLFAATPSLWVAIASGLESALVLAFQLALWLGAERASDRPERRHLPWLLAGAVGAVLTRADGFVFVGIVVAFLAARGRLRPAALTAAALAVTLGAHVAWRLSYYGYPLPNTFYVKVSGPLFERILEGAKRLLRYGASYYPSLALYIAALAWGVARALPTLRPAPARPLLPDGFRFELFLAPALLAYWVYVGGDYFGDRFLLVLYPAGILFLLERLSAVAAHRRDAVVAGLLVVQLGAFAWSPNLLWRSPRYDYWIELAAYLEERHDDPLLAIDAAGKVPFFTGWRTVDMLGLNDATIAHGTAESFRTPGHDKYDAEYVLSREPDLIAAWIQRNRDMKYGLDRERYEDAGYTLAWVMNAGLAPRDENVVDVRGATEAETQRLFDEGYVYGVLARAE